MFDWVDVLISVLDMLIFLKRGEKEGERNDVVGGINIFVLFNFLSVIATYFFIKK